MRFEFVTSAFSIFPLAALLSVVAVGCGQQAGDGKAGNEPAKVSGATDEGDEHAAEDGHDHGGWWCDEHGVPEEICAQCDTSLVAGFQKKRDWCEQHNRPDSQCFICHPEHEAKFAAQYEAKYGKKPPQREPDAEEPADDKES